MPTATSKLTSRLDTGRILSQNYDKHPILTFPTVPTIEALRRQRDTQNWLSKASNVSHPLVSLEWPVVPAKGTRIFGNLEKSYIFFVIIAKSRYLYTHGPTSECSCLFLPFLSLSFRIPNSFSLPYWSIRTATIVWRLACDRSPAISEWGRTEAKRVSSPKTKT